MCSGSPMAKDRRNTGLSPVPSPAGSSQKSEKSSRPEVFSEPWNVTQQWSQLQPCHRHSRVQTSNFQSTFLFSLSIAVRSPCPESVGPNWVLAGHFTYFLSQLLRKKHLKPMSFGRSGGNSLAKSPHCRHWTVSIAHRGQLVAAAIDVQRQARRAVDEAKGGHAAMPGPSGTQGDLLSPWPQSSYKIAQYNSKKKEQKCELRIKQ